MDEKHFTFDKNKEVVDVTIIMNIWKRNYFEEQISTLLSQTVLPKEIWVIHYENHIKIKKQLERFKNYFPNIYLFKLDKNLIFFGRHSIAINVNTKLIWIIDDDIIPGKNWLENCVKKCISLNSIITCSGRIIPKNDFRPEILTIENLVNNFVGDNKKDILNLLDTDTIVDYGCNSYFFQKKWVSAFWSIWPATFLIGDDIHLSATCKNRLNIDTVVLEQTDELTSGNLNKLYGRDENASWKKTDFLALREKVFRYHILENNWKPMLWKE